MSHLVTFHLEQGPSLVVETDGPEIRGPVMRGGHVSEMLTESGASLQLALDGVKDAAQLMFDRLCSLSKAPDELTLEFGVKLSAEAGAVIAKAAAEAHFAVTMRWTRPAGGGS